MAALCSVDAGLRSRTPPPCSALGANRAMIGTLGHHVTPLPLCLHCRAQRGRAVAISVDDHRPSEPMAWLIRVAPASFFPVQLARSSLLLTS
jgi:hypothetical protein